MMDEQYKDDEDEIDMEDVYEDDFDESADYEDEDDADDWSAYEDDGKTAAAPSGKKSSSSRVIIAGAVAVAGAIVITLMTSGGGKQPSVPRQQPAPQTMQQQNAPGAFPAQQAPQASQIPQPQPVQNTPPQPVAPAGMLSDPSAFALLDEEGARNGARALPPMPNQIAQEDGFTSLTPMPAEESAAQADLLPTGDAASSPALADLDKKLSALVARLDRVEGKLDNLDEIRTLQASVKKLEERVGKLANIKAQTGTTAAAAKTPAKPAGAKTGTGGSAPKKAPAPVTHTTWVLKAAQPGEAYVSEKGTSDMITVRVGDTLPGLGKIKSINNVSGQWVVTAERGEIKP